MVPAVVVVTWAEAEGGWKGMGIDGCPASGGDFLHPWDHPGLAAPTTLHHTWKFWLSAPHSHKAEMAEKMQHFPSSITCVWVS